MKFHTRPEFDQLHIHSVRITVKAAGSCFVILLSGAQRRNSFQRVPQDLSSVITLFSRFKKVQNFRRRRPAVGPAARPPAGTAAAGEAEGFKRYKL